MRKKNESWTHWFHPWAQNLILGNTCAFGWKKMCRELCSSHCSVIIYRALNSRFWLNSLINVSHRLNCRGPRVTTEKLWQSFVWGTKKNGHENKKKNWEERYSGNASWCDARKSRRMRKRPILRMKGRMNETSYRKKPHTLRHIVQLITYENSHMKTLQLIWYWGIMLPWEISAR